MERTKLHYENRIANLRRRGEVENYNLIRKCLRALRKMEK